MFTSSTFLKLQVFKKIQQRHFQRFLFVFQIYLIQTVSKIYWPILTKIYPVGFEKIDKITSCVFINQIQKINQKCKICLKKLRSLIFEDIVLKLNRQQRHCLNKISVKFDKDL